MHSDPNRASVLLYGGHFVSDTDFMEYGDLWAWDGLAVRARLPLSAPEEHRPPER